MYWQLLYTFQFGLFPRKWFAIICSGAVNILHLSQLVRAQTADVYRRRIEQQMIEIPFHYICSPLPIGINYGPEVIAGAL